MSGAPGQLSGLYRGGQCFARVVGLDEDAQEELTHRLLEAGTCCFAESHLAAGQDHGFPVTPKSEQRARSGADCAGEQLGVVEALGEDEGRFGPFQGTLGRRAAVIRRMTTRRRGLLSRARRHLRPMASKARSARSIASER